MVHRGAVRPYVLAAAYPVVHPPVRFAIVATGRCGSELLVAALDSRDDIRCEGEVLGVPRRFQVAHLHGRVVGARLRGVRAWGCKLTPFTLVANPLLGSPESFVEHLHREGFQLVYLRRRDLVRHALSHISARERGFHQRSDDAPVAWAPLVVDPVDLIAHMAHVEVDEALLDRCAAAADGLQLVYEDDLEPPGAVQATADRIADHLGLDHAPVRAAFAKVTPHNLCDSVLNWDEVERALRATRFAESLATIDLRS